jgi:hypothetical protein
VVLGIMHAVLGPDSVTRREFFLWKNGNLFTLTATSER